KMIVIGVTGTSGKSTTVDFITRNFEEAGYKTASLSSVRFKIGDDEKKNQLKMTMPGRLVIQKFLRHALDAGCKYAVLEVTSEGIKQSRHKFINFNTAVFTNLSPEHIESHGGLEKYRSEKVKLFAATKNIHILNGDDEHLEYFIKNPAKKKYFFGITNEAVDVRAEHIEVAEGSLGFKLQDTSFKLQVLGTFNIYNALAAISVAVSEGISLEVCKIALEKVAGIPGRMEVVSKTPLVVVDYAHTPEQLEKVYQTFSQAPSSKIQTSSLVCVLGSCGGGRDKWKRPELGKIAAKYCREIIITNEDPYDEDPLEIMEAVASGIENHDHSIVIDRKEAIKK
ncbi:MAG: Mur ligase family protein, partial [Candidatus Paceibacterales bacterium]